MCQKSLFSSLLFSSLLFSSLLFSSLLLTTSCQKENQIPLSNEIDFRDVSMLTAEELIVRENLEKTASLVASINLDRDALEEVMQGVKVSLDLGFDEQFRFKEILSPQLKSYKQGRSNAFADRFRAALANTAKSSNSLEEFLIGEDIQIYWPYSESWDGKTQPYVTFNPINGAETVLAIRQVALEDGGVVTDSLFVDEEFAKNNPVWVINFCENEEWEFKRAEARAVARAEVSEKSSLGIYQLSVGHVKSTKHYDTWIQGGDEYKFVILGGVITPGGSVANIKNLVTVNVSRGDINKDIKKAKWVRCYYELDDDWLKEGNNDEKGRAFGLVEYDKVSNEVKLSYEPKVTIKGITLSAPKAEIKISSYDHDWIKADTYHDRDTFYGTTDKDMGNGTQDGYRIYASGGVYWTLPLRKF